VTTRTRRAGDALAAALQTGPALLYLALLFAVPMAVVAAFSITSMKAGAPAFGDFTLANYRRAFDPLYLNVLLRSSWLALLTTVLALLIAYPCTLALRALPPRRRTLLLALVIIPSWMNLLIKNYAWIIILRRDGVLNTLLLSAGIIDEPLTLMFNDGAVLVGLVHTYLPFMILPLYANLTKLDSAHLEAAADLGASPMVTFFTVTLPLSTPGIIAGSMLVFIPAIGEYVIPALLGGPDTLMIGRVLWDEFFSSRDWPVASAVAIVMLVLVVAPIMWLQSIQNRRELD
jgi:putrescine transport system permease protein